MEILINGTDFNEIASKVIEQDSVNLDIITQLAQISNGNYRDDAIVRLTNSEKDLGTP